MSENVKLPETDEKFLGFVEKELVVLKSEVDDVNIKRVYEVIENNNGRLTVEVKLETPNENFYYGKTAKEKQEEGSILGKKFENMNANKFKPFH